MSAMDFMQNKYELNRKSFEATPQDSLLFGEHTEVIGNSDAAPSNLID
jgi:hypothetical protein